MCQLVQFLYRDTALVKLHEIFVAIINREVWHESHFKKREEKELGVHTYYFYVWIGL